MNDVQNYVIRQKELTSLLNSNKRHLINIEVAKRMRRQRLIAYLLLIFTWPLLLHNIYLKRYGLFLVELFYLYFALIVFSSNAETFMGSGAVEDLGFWYFGIACAFFWIYDCVTIPAATEQLAEKRKWELYKAAGILPLSELKAPPERNDSKPHSTKLLKAIGKKVNAYLEAKSHGKNIK